MSQRSHNSVTYLSEMWPQILLEFSCEKLQLVIVSVQSSDNLTLLRKRPRAGWCSAVLEELLSVHLAGCAVICHFNYSFSAKKYYACFERIFST